MLQRSKCGSSSQGTSCATLPAARRGELADIPWSHLLWRHERCLATANAVARSRGSRGGPCSAEPSLPPPGPGLRDGRARAREEAAAPALALRLPRRPFPPLGVPQGEPCTPAAVPPLPRGSAPRWPRPLVQAAWGTPPGPGGRASRPQTPGGIAPREPPPRRHGLGVREGCGALPPHEPAGAGAELPARGDGGLGARPVLHPEPGRC